VKFLQAFASALACLLALVLTPSIGWSQPIADPCDEQAICQAQKGAQLLAQGRIEEAAVALEKALLLEPNLPGAQLDYAQALALIGLKGSARAMLADVLQRPDIQPTLKSKLEGAQNFQSPQIATSLATPANMQNQWQWSTVAQTALGHETNLNSATFTDSLTLMLSNGPVTIGLSDAAKPIAGPATKTLLAVQGTTRADSGPLALGEISLSAYISNKKALQADGLTGIKPERNQTAEALAKYSLPMIAGAASGQWQLAVGGTQFWLGGQSAYTDSGFNLKFNWDRNFEPGIKGVLNLEGQSCKLAPSLGQTHQSLTSIPWSPFKQIQTGQLSAWVRYATSSDAQIYSELLGDLKTTTRRADWGMGLWVPLDKSWSAGLNLEATSQRSNNTLFNLKNSGVYAGIRWSEN